MASATRPRVIGCGVFGGRSPRTGLPVGERHRWNGGAWGEGSCVYCGRSLKDVLEKPATELSLDEAIARGEAEGAAPAWRPSFYEGRPSTPKGWYVQRPGPGNCGTEWMRNPDGTLVRRDTEAQARGVIAAAAGPAT